MTSLKLEQIIRRIREERQRQTDLPGSEWDLKNRPGDWVAIIGHYIYDEVRRNGENPTQEAFEDSLVKAAAVILATLEHTDLMKSRGELQ